MTTNAPAIYVELTVAGDKVTSKMFDLVAEALYNCEGVIDPDLEADFAAKTLTFHMGFAGPIEPDQALGKVLGIARTALHAAGLGTPGWENVRIENADSKERQLIDC